MSRLDCIADRNSEMGNAYVACFLIEKSRCGGAGAFTIFKARTKL